ncbi:MAG: ABC transporter permease [Muribaculaceae bacterium]|nr:ABC transporter permease [Muribaculaceae bacterium]
MKRLRLIIAHEYMMIVGKKSFIIMTLLIPFLIVIVGAVPVLIAYLNESADKSVEQIAVLDQSGGLGNALVPTDKYKFIPINATGAPETAARDFYKKASESLTAVVVIPADVEQTARVTIYSEQTIDVSTKEYINGCLGDTIAACRLASYGIDNLEKIVDDLKVDMSVNSIKWDENGNEQTTSTELSMVIGMVLALIIYTFVLMYGAMIMNSVVEEKTNRIVEVVVSSCRPVELMFGKIIGVGLVGLTQFAIWVVILGVGGSVLSMLGLGSMAAADPSTMQAATAAASEEGMDMQNMLAALGGINYGSLLVNFVLYFIGGYLLYASLFAAFGSAVDQASDASQFTTPIILFMVIALYAGIACASNPNGPMAVWCSMIPFTSPVVMMVRLPYDVPIWQQLLSIVLLFATAFAVTWLAARIYRTGILLYGKKRSFKDLFKWVVNK